MRLIDADALLSELNNLEPRCSNKYVKQGIDDGLHYYMPKILDEQPTIDAVPVVRCKDCIHYEPCEGGKDFCCFHAIGIVPDDFCSYGERKDGDC
jgi:hypothetical protein